MQTCSRCQRRTSETDRTCPDCGEALPGGPSGVGDYRFERIVYEGEHTTTYRAAHRETGEVVAVVRFLDPLEPERIGRLEADVAGLRSIAGDRVVRVLGFEVSEEGEAYRIKAWVEGEPVPVLVRRGYFKPIGTALWFLEEILRAVEDLHAAGFRAPYLVTDDILVTGTKPGSTGARGVRVNFHGSRFLDRKTDRPGPSLRHLLDHHPDLRPDARLVPQSDIYTLGAIFFEVLTGERPGPEPTLDRTPGLPAPLEHLVLGMLHPDPTRRPQTTAEVHAALARARRARSAERDGTGRARPRKSVWRAAVALVVVAVLLVIGWGLMQPAPVREVREAVVFIRTRFRLQAPDIGYNHDVLNEWHTVKGTGFLVEPKTVLTARHVAAPWIRVLQGHPCVPGVEITKLEEQERRLVRQIDFEIALWLPGNRVLARGVDGKLVWDFQNAFRTRGDTPVVRMPLARRGPESIGTDLAAIPLRRSLDAQPIPLVQDRSFRDIRPGARLYLWSYPGGESPFEGGTTANPSFVQGAVSLVEENQLNIQIPNYGGSSGGPVLDASGRIMGIALQSLQDEHDFTIALGSPALHRFLADVKAGRVPPVGAPPGQWIPENQNVPRAGETR